MTTPSPTSDTIFRFSIVRKGTHDNDRVFWAKRNLVDVLKLLEDLVSIPQDLADGLDAKLLQRTE